MNDEIIWPIHVIDFEASGLGERTYPIEIGLSTVARPGAIPVTWSALIAPTRDWLEQGEWQIESEAIHGLKREDLGIGLTPTEAITHLAGLLGDGRAWMDGGRFDIAWARRLMAASTEKPIINLGHWDDLVSRLPERRERRLRMLLSGDPPHRAGPDAERLARTFSLVASGRMDLESGE